MKALVWLTGAGWKDVTCFRGSLPPYETWFKATLSPYRHDRYVLHLEHDDKIIGGRSHRWQAKIIFL